MALYTRNSACESVRLDDEWMIVDTERATITRLNHAGGVCWTLLSAPQTAASLAEELRRMFDAPPETAERDLDAFLADLHGCGLVNRVS